jgi:hypothetical protein
MVRPEDVGHLGYRIADENYLLLLTSSWRRGGNLFASRPALAVTSRCDRLPVDYMTAVGQRLVGFYDHIGGERLAHCDPGLEWSAQHGPGGLELRGRLGEADSCERRRQISDSHGNALLQ